MILRVLLFTAYAVVGAVLSYGALYLFSPMGFAIVAASALVVLALPRAGGNRWPEALGLLAGPGLFLLLAAGTGGDPALGVAGGAIASVAVVAYMLAGRARCARVS